MARDPLNLPESVQIQSCVESETTRHSFVFTNLPNSHEAVTESLGSMSSADFVGVCNEVSVPKVLDEMLTISGSSMQCPMLQPGDSNPTGCSEGIADEPCSDSLGGIDVSSKLHDVDAAGLVSLSLADEVVPSALGAESDGVSQKDVVVSQMRSVLADNSAGEVSGAGLQSSPDDGIPTGYFMEGSSVETYSDAITRVDIPTALLVLVVATSCVGEHVAGSFLRPLAILDDTTIEDGSRGAQQPSMSAALASEQKPCHQAVRIPERSSSGNVAAMQGLSQCDPNASPNCHQGPPARRNDEELFARQAINGWHLAGVAPAGHAAIANNAIGLILLVRCEDGVGHCEPVAHVAGLLFLVLSRFAGVSRIARMPLDFAVLIQLISE
ncbi:hypothetical protein Nepgr_023036 [Nepenthes gracilis]|uniref:Uncharacterized protein n=1 Tax=Nepenthes gracilis TaxID=150966 RepID=A0AAD3XYN3_NEPGR|nr:hypothetical protein Nepgr_023036 [Nepenthes gracilis]